MSETSPQEGIALPAHLARGAIGFGCLLGAFALAAAVGPVGLLLAVPGLIALRGCPMCWTAELVAAVSAGRLHRSCTTDGACTLTRSSQPQGGEADWCAPPAGPAAEARAHAVAR